MTSTKTQTYNFALQKYMLLQEQHEELSSHLQQIRPRKASVTGVSVSTRSSSTSSISTSPRRYSGSGECKLGRSRAPTGRDAAGPGSLGTILDEETIHAISAEEQRLFDVNESIKRALTELLNCDAVRGNNSMRMWAQARLMETEKELRSGRRRRSSPCMELYLPCASDSISCCVAASIHRPSKVFYDAGY
ncbi:hypothetical protein MAC_02836 [Metarhizium acridum CQMa 102]|uniref:Uncharacterized protein n=1 Tax=Metarhizium acridum (strain CQMa 102) TaxID=655827 RepID=E9DYY8_METAQ|nr:uncharacterized protein MAC_02836 [Metarhizium acridum CQMa 102]EFY91165.1 hypothetical protein MAC_02836 [Metarhizium acridum CQMa 102]